MRESFPRQIDKEVYGSLRRQRSEIIKVEKKGQISFPLHSLGLYFKNVPYLRTVSGLNLLANPVTLKCKLWEWVW